MSYTKIISEDGSIIFDEYSEKLHKECVENKKNEIFDIHNSIYTRLEDMSKSLCSYVFTEKLPDNYSIKHKIHLLKSNLHLLETKLDELIDLQTKYIMKEK